jgi:hypothetical protein
MNKNICLSLSLKMSVFTFDVTIWSIVLILSCSISVVVLLGAKYLKNYEKFFMRLYLLLMCCNFAFSFVIYFFTVKAEYFYVNIIQILVLFFTILLVYRYLVTKTVSKIMVYSLFLVEVCFSILYLYGYQESLTKDINYVFYVFCIQGGTSLFFQFILLFYTKIYHKEKKQKINLSIQFPDEECSICLEKFKEPVVKTDCEHFFHKECIDKAFEVNKNCPLCRMNLV